MIAAAGVIFPPAASSYAADALYSAAHPAASPQQLRAPRRLHVCAAIVSERNREKDDFWPRGGATWRAAAHNV
jgi:hypothetical protein